MEIIILVGVILLTVWKLWQRDKVINAVRGRIDQLENDLLSTAVREWEAAREARGRAWDAAIAPEAAAFDLAVKQIREDIAWSIVGFLATRESNDAALKAAQRALEEAKIRATPAYDVAKQMAIKNFRDATRLLSRVQIGGHGAGYDDQRVDPPPLLASQGFGGLFWLLLIAVFAYRFAVEGTWRDWPVVNKIASTDSTKKEPIQRSEEVALSKAEQSDSPDAPQVRFANPEDGYRWLLAMSDRLAPSISSTEVRVEFLKTLHHEAMRAGVDPQLVLALIDELSEFQKYAASPDGAKGYMQVAPAWVEKIGRSDDNLFHLRTNLRYGCVILRHYLDLNGGDLYRALIAYRQQAGKSRAGDTDSKAFPNKVLERWKTRWRYEGRLA